jgi:hypothetical protein
MRRRRWADNQVQLWPFTAARQGKEFRQLGALIDSGEDEYPGCHLRLYLWWFTLLVEVPPILWPYRVKMYARTWDADTVERLGRDWYWDEYPREIGFTLSHGGHLSLKYGRQTHDSSTTNQKGWFLPWTQLRHVRQSWYGLQGEHRITLFDNAKFSTIWQRMDWICRWTDETPKMVFRFRDYDGEQINAVTHIEEREWHHGTGSFRWLSWFVKPIIKRSLEIKFSSEVGHRKGSWKGGTIGHSIELLSGELHEAAFRRYCGLRGLEFDGLAGASGTV